MSSVLRKIKRFFLTLFILACLLGCTLAFAIWNNNVKSDLENEFILIPSNSTFTDLLTQLKNDSILLSNLSFIVVAKLMKYGTGKIPSGRYKIEPGWSNRQLITKLRSGVQDPVSITINSVRELKDLAPRIAAKLEVDSIELMQILSDTTLMTEYGYNRFNFMTMFIPNTYHFFWNTPARACLDRLKYEHEEFWKQNGRRAKSVKLSLTESEVYTLASIVEKETNSSHEKSIIAGVYLNRIKLGIPLQADPTVIFATGDFTIRRVLNKHLEIDSPYNTYMNSGLPPGPICMPSIETLDAALNAQKHDYIYFCAKPGYGSEHVFASTLEEHNQNAKEYRRWLNRENIK